MLRSVRVSYGQGLYQVSVVDAGRSCACVAWLRESRPSTRYMTTHSSCPSYAVSIFTLSSPQSEIELRKVASCETGITDKMAAYFHVSTKSASEPPSRERMSTEEVYEASTSCRPCTDVQIKNLHRRMQRVCSKRRVGQARETSSKANGPRCARRAEGSAGLGRVRAAGRRVLAAAERAAGRARCCCSCSTDTACGRRASGRGRGR